MSTKDYVRSPAFEKDWKLAKREVERVVKPLFSELSAKIQFRATVYKSSQIAWIEIREPHPSVRLIAVSLPRDVEPLTLRVTCWFYDDAKGEYQQWCDAAPFLYEGQSLTPFKDKVPRSSWKHSPALKDVGLIGAEHAYRELDFDDESSLTELLVSFVKSYSKHLLSVLTHQAKTFTLLGPNGEFFKSTRKGQLDGNSKEKRYGLLDCAAANRALDKGYAGHRVFFANEAAAIAAGYKPCGTCMRERYLRWKAGGQPGSDEYPWTILPRPNISA